MSEDCHVSGGVAMMNEAKKCIHCNRTLANGHGSFARCEGGKTQFESQPVADVGGGLPAQDHEQNLRYATQIAEYLHKKCYPEVTQWKPISGDLFGVLMQIDNMCTGVQREAEVAELKANLATPGETAEQRAFNEGVETCATRLERYYNEGKYARVLRDLH